MNGTHVIAIEVDDLVEALLIEVLKELQDDEETAQEVVLDRVRAHIRDAFTTIATLVGAPAGTEIIRADIP